MEFTAQYFWTTFGTEAIEQWDIAIAEHGLPVTYEEEEWSELYSWCNEEQNGEGYGVVEQVTTRYPQFGWTLEDGQVWYRHNDNNLAITIEDGQWLLSSPADPLVSRDTLPELIAVACEEYGLACI